HHRYCTRLEEKKQGEASCIPYLQKISYNDRKRKTSGSEGDNSHGKYKTFVTAACKAVPLPITLYYDMCLFGALPDWRRDPFGICPK
ncbi:MAG: hypothetical protein K2N37_00495, partial [Lachnospiraceae bacterium]|nr:hypothetical protein [Lachnospiraceae bacterium]